MQRRSRRRVGREKGGRMLLSRVCLHMLCGLSLVMEMSIANYVCVGAQMISKSQSS